MKATGIVRRLDDLGRLVIPKEIRKRFRMKEGDSIEFFIDNERIVIQKFDVMSRHMEDITIMCDTLKAMYQNAVFFVHDDWQVAQDKQLQELFMKSVRSARHMISFENTKVYADSDERYKGIIYPVTACGDWFGSFILLFDRKELGHEDLYATEAFVQLLSRQQAQ